jgi:predicted nucleic acid-binding protein
MTPDRELQAQIDRAEHAHRLLNDQLLQDALAAIKAEVVKTWVDCPARDHEGKEALWQLAKTADKFEALLRGFVETGKLATMNLKAFEERKSLLRLVVG